MSNLQVKKYSWKHIVDTLTLPSDEMKSLKYRYAIEYFCNFYSGDNPQLLFSDKDVKYIQNEIKEEAEHKIRLALNDKAREDLREVWPDLDDYINSLATRPRLF